MLMFDLIIDENIIFLFRVILSDIFFLKYLGVLFDPNAGSNLKVKLV